MQDFFKEIGQRVRKFREDVGYTQRQIEQLCYTPHNFMSQFESGKVWPNHSVFEFICQTMDTTPGEVLEGLHWTYDGDQEGGDPLARQIGNRIRGLREGKGQSQSEFALSLGLAKEDVPLMEDGGLVAPIETLKQIRMVHGVTVDWLLGLSDNMHLYSDGKPMQLDSITA